MRSLEDYKNLYEASFPSKEFNLNPSGLYEPIKHILSLPAKRIRPVFVLIGCELYSGDMMQALQAAQAIEIFHNFSLVHDDVMDKADLRRGKPTVHHQFGLNAAILSGDVMLAYAYKYLANLENQFLANSLQVFTKTAIEVCEGQQMDMDFEKESIVSKEAYLQMIKFKTSVLLACALQIGSIIGHADEKDQRILYDIGINLGLSFQIKDDWLDCFGDAEKVGKKVGGDIIQNKKTLLLISLLERASEQDKQEINSLFTERNDDHKVQQFQQLFKQYEVDQKVLHIADEFYLTACELVKTLTVSKEKKDFLVSLAARISNRAF